MNTTTKEKKKPKTSKKASAIVEKKPEVPDTKPSPKRIKAVKARAKEAVESIVELGQNLKTNLFISKGEEPILSSETSTELKKEYKRLLSTPPTSPLASQWKTELEKFRDASLMRGKMPEVIETHADISLLDNHISLNGGPFRVARGNWIQIDLGSKSKNEILCEVLNSLGEQTNPKLSKVPVLPTTFINRYEGLMNILNSSEKKKSSSVVKRNENQAKLIAWACMAYLEIIEEENQEPVNTIGEPSSRSFKPSNDGISLFKDLLLSQALEQEAPEGTPIISEGEMIIKVKSSISSAISTKEATELACILAERELEAYKHSYKRETLFKMRAFLASRFFEVTKKHRTEDTCPLDRILTQKPRYKTPCIWLITHRNNQRAEVLAVKPTSNVTYWGNPESEKDKYSIVPITQNQTIWEKVDLEAIKGNLIKHQTLLTWTIAGISLLLIAIGSLSKLPDGTSPSKTQLVNTIQTSQTHPNDLNAGINSGEEDFVVKDILPNNTEGGYALDIKSPSKNNTTTKSNSMEW
jgi:hypothetical protein